MSTVRLHEQGYRRYEGARHGVGGAVTSTIVHTLRFILGLRRRARSKLLPWGIIALTYLPAIGFVAATLLLPATLRRVAGQVLPGPEEYLGGIILLVYLATAIAGPAALCRDRRSGALALYLASPLSRDTYLAAKAVAAIGFVAAVTVVPPLIYVLGTVIIGAGPDGPVAVLRTVSQALGSGIALALLFGSLSLAAASLSDRTGAAAGTIVLYLVVSGAVVGTTVFALDAPQALLLLDVNQVATDSVARIYGDRLNDGGNPTWAVLGALAAWTAAFGAFTRWRYQRLAVTR
ncbi:MAG: ABC transporter permease [Actinobacteria bacterium]|nr:ABC transporter permease [Actinomycetota bacterium]